MKRREFFTASCAAGIAAASLSSASAQQQAKERSFFEIRKLRVKGEKNVKKIIDFGSAVMGPGFQENGLSPFGMAIADPKLNNVEEDGTHEIYCFMPYKTWEDATNLGEKFRKNTEIMKKYAEYREGTSSKNPVFETMDRTLLRFIESTPWFEVPTLAKDRVLQLRIYRSFDMERNRAKIRMFEEGGELALFRECGMNPVFFGDALYGTFLPNLTYMLSFESEQHMKDGWAKFVKHPGWIKLKDDPEYADTATEIQNIYLRPCAGSQI